MFHAMVRALAAALVLVSAAPGALAQAEGGDNPVVATVNGQELHLDEVFAAYQALPQQMQAMPFRQLYPQLVERVITSRLLADAGREAGVHEDPELQAELRRTEDRLIERAMFRAAIDERLTDEALREAYDGYLEESKDAREIHTRHILVETEEAAQTLIAELEGGADFAALAKEHSVGPSSTDGGDLGFIGMGDTVPPFQAAAFALEPGKFTEAPVRTQFGWHVIKVEEARDAEPKPFEAMEGELRNKLTEEIVTAVIEEARAGADIEVVDPPPLPGAAAAE